MPDDDERTRRRRKRPRTKKPSKRLASLLGNLGWVLAATAVGLPLLALLLHLLNRA